MPSRGVLRVGTRSSSPEIAGWEDEPSLPFRPRPAGIPWKTVYSSLPPLARPWTKPWRQASRRAGPATRSWLHEAEAAPRGPVTLNTPATADPPPEPGPDPAPTDHTRGDHAGIDIVDEWEQESFPASDPPPTGDRAAEELIDPEPIEPRTVRPPARSMSSACRDADPALFFPIGTRGPALAQATAARAVCSRCPVAAPCLERALTDPHAEGIWAGLDSAARRAHRARALAATRVKAAWRPARRGA